MEGRSKETRAVNQVGVRRNDPLLGRSGRRHRSRPAVERSKDHGLPPSSPVGDKPTTEDRAAHAARVADHRSDAGPSAQREASSSHRHSYAETQSMRDVPDRGGLDHSQTLGDHTPELSQPGASRGARAGGEAGDQKPEAEGLNEESQQVGRGQRASPAEGRLVSQALRQSPGTALRSKREISISSSSTPSELRREADSSTEEGGRGKKSRSTAPSRGRKVNRGSPKREAQGRKPKREASPLLERSEKSQKRGRPEGSPTSCGAGSAEAQSYEDGSFGVSSRKVQDLMGWLRQHEGEHLTAAQMAQYHLLQAVNLNGTFGRLIESSLKPTWGQDERVRNLMPLPLWPDVLTAMQEVIDRQKYKDQPGGWRERGNTKTQAARALRNTGNLLWHGLVVVALNWMHSGGNIGEGIGPPAGRASNQQEGALRRLWELVKVFVDEKPKKGGVPRTPRGGWESELEVLRVSYTGEVVQKARPLTLEQVLPGLPSPDHGGLVNILEVVDERLKRRLERPELLLKEVFQEIPTPQVMCSDSEWEKVVLAMYERHLVTPVTRKPVVEGKPVLNGAFGVVKPDRFTESGLPILRMIMDLRASNTILEQLEGDVSTLTGAASFQKIVMGEGDELLLSGDDLTAAFYLFRLPEAFAEYLVLRKPVRKSLFWPGQTGTTLVGICVLPMGWSSAVAVMQNAHRQLALRSEMRMGAGLLGKAEIRKDALFPSLEDVPAWTIYLDDTTVIEKVSKSIAQELQGKPAEEQEKLRRVYEWWGIPTNTSKALERVRTAERLGAVLDGENGLLRASTKRALDLMGLGAWLRGQGTFSTTALQIYAGKAVHILQFPEMFVLGTAGSVSVDLTGPSSG